VTGKRETCRYLLARNFLASNFLQIGLASGIGSNADTKNPNPALAKAGQGD
jgi:hypothetical protein